MLFNNYIQKKYFLSFIKHVLTLVYNIIKMDHLLDQLTISMSGKIVPKSAKITLGVTIGHGGEIQANASSYQERVLLKKPSMQYLVRRAVHKM